MAKKDKGSKVPKSIAGLKLSRRTRKRIGAVLGLLGKPEAKGLLGLAIAAIAGTLAARRGTQTKAAGRGRR